MRLLRQILGETPNSGGLYTALSPIYTAIRYLTRSLDAVASGGFSKEVLTVQIIGTSSFSYGQLIYVNDAGVATSSLVEGANAVYVEAGAVRFTSAICKPGIPLTPNKQYWLQLDDGLITSTPNPNFRLQLLGTALSPSDLHFIYSPPTQ